MKKIVKIFIFFAFILNTLHIEVYATSQIEAVRQYLRYASAPYGQQKEVAKALKVDPSLLSKFIAINSSVNSPKIIKNFQAFFPETYMQVIGTVPAIPQVSNSFTNTYSTNTSVTKIITNIDLQMPIEVMLPDKGPTAINSQNLSDVERQLLYGSVDKFQRFGPQFLPTLPLNKLYIRALDGRISIKDNGLLIPFEIRLYGEDSAGRFGWITKGDRTYECFALAKDSPEDRVRLGKKFTVGSGYQLSHGVDCIHTPYPGSNFNSNRDPWNLVAANPTLNMHVRTALTQRMGIQAYGEINLYEQSLYIQQQRKADHHTSGDRWIVESGYIPTGFIFKAFQGTTTRIYFFPENIQSSEEHSTASQYELLYEHAKRYCRDPKYETHVVPYFEVQNAAHLFMPIIYDGSQLHQINQVEILKAFFLAINVGPYRSLESNLNLYKKMKIPFSWNGVLGYTREQVDKLCEAAFSDKKIDGNISSRFPHWSGFRLPVSHSNETVEWKDASEQQIPAFSTVLNGEAIRRFNNFTCFNLLDQVAKSPAASYRMKLGVAQVYIDQKYYEKAGIILEFLKNLSVAEGNLGDVLWLAELYIRYFKESSNPLKLNPQVYQTYLRRVVENKKTTAKIEELLKIRKFNSRMNDPLFFIDENFQQFTKISPEESKTLKKKYIPIEKVKKLTRILESVGNLEEFSLHNVIFTTDDLDVILDCYEDDCVYDWVSREKFFWKYNNLFKQVLSTLEMHSPILKKLSLRNLGFGFLSHSDKEVSYKHDTGHVLNALYCVDFPQLEELHITGYIDSSDETAFKILENLKLKFPCLQKLYYSLGAKQIEYEVDPKNFNKFVRILRGSTDNDKLN